jgi:hypothetical protein
MLPGVREEQGEFLLRPNGWERAEFVAHAAKHQEKLTNLLGELEHLEAMLRTLGQRKG